MPTCPYHGGKTPCRGCFDAKRGAFARRLDTDQFPDQVVVKIPHDHGDVRPCKIRCGMNEGLCVLNNQANVTDLFTDGLVGCTQVILRSGVATFVCHIGVGARGPAQWIAWAADQFRRRYGTITYCAIITSSGSDGVLHLLTPELKKQTSAKIFSKHSTGCMINLANGDVIDTPVNLHADLNNVAGWKTAREVIALRMLGMNLLGEAMAGDYRENCPRCARKEREAMQREDELDKKYEELERRFG